MRNIIDKLRHLQSFIKEQGLGGSVLSLPAPKTLMLPSASTNDNKEELIFDQIITEPEIAGVSRDLFESGYYNVAVSESFKALDLFIKNKIADHSQSGVKLAQIVFSEKDPKLVWTDRSTVSMTDQHKGYGLIFQGSFLGIRNPTAHELEWIDDPIEAFDAIILAQHLLRKVKAASVTP